MTRRDNTGQQFSEDIERLLNGEEPIGGHDDADYQETVLFARKLLELRREPDPAFTGKLRRSLLTNMAEQHAQAPEPGSWFMRLFSRPGLRLAVVSTFVVLAAVGLVWRAGMLSPAMTSAPDEASGMLTTPSAPSMPPPEPQSGAPETARAAGDTKAQMNGESVTWDAAGPIVMTAYSAPTVDAREPVNISIMFRNVSQDNYQLTPFPPSIAIREAATGRVVYTFAVGTSSCRLSAMTDLWYDVEWDQRDSHGAPVNPGNYRVDVEMTQALLENRELAASIGAYDAIGFDILSLPSSGIVTDSGGTQD